MAQVSKIDKHRKKVGKHPDSLIAELAGVTVSAVAKYRTQRGIPRFIVPVAANADVPAEKGEPQKTIVRKTKLTTPVEAAPVEAAPVEAKANGAKGKSAPVVTTAAPAVSTEPPTEPAIVAPEAKGAAKGKGASKPAPETVPAKGKLAKVPEPVAVAAEPVAPQVKAKKPAPKKPGRAADLAQHVDIIGILTDAEVGKKVGLSGESVRKYRKDHGIPSAHEKAAMAAAATPAPVPVVAATASVKAPPKVAKVKAAAPKAVAEEPMKATSSKASASKTTPAPTVAEAVAAIKAATAKAATPKAVRAPAQKAKKPAPTVAKHVYPAAPAAPEPVIATPRVSTCWRVTVNGQAEVVHVVADSLAAAASRAQSAFGDAAVVAVDRVGVGLA